MDILHTAICLYGLRGGFIINTTRYTGAAAWTVLHSASHTAHKYTYFIFSSS